MVPWPTPNGEPNQEVVKGHAAELAKDIPGSVTPEQSGLVSRRVQCHRCRFPTDDTVRRCGLYEKLNSALPEVFDLDAGIEPHACCNAQEPKDMAMAKLSTDQRSHLAASTFGLPGQRAYPMPDRSHAANAKARASQQYAKGNLSAPEKAQIDRKADARLAKSPGGYVPNQSANPGQPHPRMQALSIAAATHLHNAGHMPANQKAAIHAKARANLNQLKQQQPPMPMTFGSLAPMLNGPQRS